MRMRIASAMVILLAGMVTAQYDPPYGGPPMWSRRREDYPPPPRPDYPRPHYPNPGRWGPQMSPCIYYGDCRGPRR